mgnify:CR=1 FL=1
MCVLGLGLGAPHSGMGWGGGIVFSTGPLHAAVVAEVPPGGATGTAGGKVRGRGLCRVDVRGGGGVQPVGMHTLSGVWWGGAIGPCMVDVCTV